jgi:hypothetical protein
MTVRLPGARSSRRSPDPPTRERIAGVEDADLIHRIGELAEEERQLEEAHASTADGLNESERERLERLQVTLDQAWDLLRQRRALRHAGRDPDEAEERPADTVERYLQ